MKSTGAATSETDRLRLAVTRLHRRLRQLGPDELTLTQHSALATIARHGPLALGDLASRENVAPPTITKVVGALEGAGLVARSADPEDGRVALVSVTRSGRDSLDAVVSLRTAWLDERLRSLEPEDRDRLLAALDALETLGGEHEDDR